MTMKKLLLSLLVLLTVLTAGSATYADGGVATPSQLWTQIESLQSRQDTAHEMAECARVLGYAEDNVIITTAQDEWCACQTQIELCTASLAEFTEYPTATYVWKRLKEARYNDAVAAGIIGNMASETCGTGLALDHTARTSYYYGLCQWSHSYDVWGFGLEEQVDFLLATIQYEFDTYGYAYYKGFDYNAFLGITDCQQAAYAFAKCYERCASWTYSSRQSNASIAYEYFSG